MEEKSDVARVKKCLGSYQFRIEGYSEVSTKVADCVESPEFLLCGHKWQLRIFPGGSLENHKGFMSFYLASKSNKIARACYKLIVSNQIVGGEDEVFSSSGIRVFEAKGEQIDGWGRDKFMTATMLSDPDFGFNVDGSVTFKVEITVYGGLEEVQIPFAEKCGDRLFGNSIAQCLLNLWLTPLAPDVYFIVGSDNVRIPAHRCVLMARSSVFYAMFSSGMHEVETGEVRVPDFEAADIKEMLHYIYTDSCSRNNAVYANTETYFCIGGSNSSDVLDSHLEQVDDTQLAHSISPYNLFRAAVKYQIPGLIYICEEYYISRLTTETAITILQMADAYGVGRLKHKALQFIAQNASTIIQSKEFSDLDESLLVDANKLIVAVNKRKGCGVSSAGTASTSSVGSERERRFNSICSIM